MLDKIRIFPIVAYLAFTGFVSDLKKDERGLSDAVVAVLLVLVAVLAVIAIWGLLGDSIESWWKTITDRSAEIK